MTKSLSKDTSKKGYDFDAPDRKQKGADAGGKPKGIDLNKGMKLHK